MELEWSHVMLASGTPKVTLVGVIIRSPLSVFPLTSSVERLEIAEVSADREMENVKLEGD